MPRDGAAEVKVDGNDPLGSDGRSRDERLHHMNVVSLPDDVLVGWRSL